MARLPRLFIPGFPQLVLQRGIGGSAVFADEADYERYKVFLRDAVREYEIHVHAYVLMPSHIHLVLTPHNDSATGNAMQQLGRRYVRYFNDRHKRSGTLWEGRYRSTVIEPNGYLLAACQYVEMNPVRAGMVGDATSYLWSSARHHVGMEPDVIIQDHVLFWALGNTPFERQAKYRSLLTDGIPEHELAAIRYAAHRGWMLGELAADLENLLNRRAGPVSKGRPRRKSIEVTSG